MKKMFADYVHTYLLKYLPLQKGASENTCASYSHAFLEFYKFCRDKRKIQSHKLDFKDIDKQMVKDFCLWLEKEKNNSPQTRNLRLSAIHSLFRYIERESAEHIALCRDVISIPLKKIPIKPPSYLTKSEVEKLLRIPDATKKSERRDFVLL